MMGIGNWIIEKYGTTRKKAPIYRFIMNVQINVNTFTRLSGSCSARSDMRYNVRWEPGVKPSGLAEACCLSSGPQTGLSLVLSSMFTLRSYLKDKKTEATGAPLCC